MKTAQLKWAALPALSMPRATHYEDHFHAARHRHRLRPTTKAHGEMPIMLRATKNIILPTTITGSLPRPSWYTQNLGSRSFLDAMVNNQFREQYVDAVSIYL